MERTKVLYNNACGDWSFSDEFFSDEFLNIYRERYGMKLNMNSDSYRYDPNVVGLYEELGQKRSSHENSNIKICNYPTKWLYCMDIRVYDDRENIVFSREKAYKLLLKEIIESKIVSDENIEKYNEIEEIYKNGWNNK